MGMIKITGVERLQKKFDDLHKKMRERIFDTRAQIAREMTVELLGNLPVWSGRTIASVRWGEDANPQVEPHPQRGDMSVTGPWHSEKSFGKMSGMPLGAEPMRAGAEVMAMAEADLVKTMEGPVATLTIASVPWSLIERGAAPGGPKQHPRNVGVVSQIALATIRAKYASVLK